MGMLEGIPIPAPPNIFDMTLGRFFIRSSGDVNCTAPMPIPKGLWGKFLPASPPSEDFGSLGSVIEIYTYWLPSWEASIFEQ